MARETKADFRFERLSQWLNACASQGARHRTIDENEDENSERRKGKGGRSGKEKGDRRKFDRLHLDSCQASWRARNMQRILRHILATQLQLLGSGHKPQSAIVKN